MGAVLDAQQRQRDALRYPDISGYAAAVAAFARQRRCDMLWPVDVGAYKLMGAVELVTCGAIEARSLRASWPAGRCCSSHQSGCPPWRWHSKRAPRAQQARDMSMEQPSIRAARATDWMTS
jgi:hypothetical protein